MKIRTIFSSVMLAVLGICLTQAPANAQEFQGHFTLPEQVRWGLATLPAGDYHFTVDAARAGGVVEIRGEGKAVLAVAKIAEKDTAPEPSALLVIRNGRIPTVRTLHMAELGIDLFYSAGKGEANLLAQSDTLRIPVAMNGK